MASEKHHSRRTAAKQTEPRGRKAAKGRQSAMPARVLPMLCTPTKTPINDPDYLYEIKWDGYRIISYASGRTVKLESRGGKDYTARYPLIAAALQQLGHKVVLDGEVVALDEQGIPSFNAVQLYNGDTTPIRYYVFDILWMDGHDLKAFPLIERKQLLQDLLGDHPILRYSTSFEDGPALFEQIIQKGLEGIVAKKKDSTYQEGIRGNDWLKTPTKMRQEFVIGGWAESDRGRSFKSILFGAYNDQGKLEWIGRSGGGYKEKDMPGILKKLQRLEIKKSPFVNQVLDMKGAPVHWAKPSLVAIFEFSSWTESGRIRKPATFISFRNDKKPTEVIREIPKSITVIEQQNEEQGKQETKTTKASVKKVATEKRKQT